MFGSTPAGRARFGDNLVAGSIARGTGLTLTATIAASQYGAGLSLSAVVSAPNSNSLTLYATIAATPVFTINGVQVLAPDQITYAPVPVIDYLVIGQPLVQGIKQMSWTYSVMLATEFEQIIALYDPTNALVLLTYGDEHGSWVQRQATWLPPQYGTRSTVIVSGVTFTFTILHSP